MVGKKAKALSKNMKTLTNLAKKEGIARRSLGSGKKKLLDNEK